ncbi:MAG: hypothetical protein CFH10_01656 [Alphaproteobacteria bacterium MarineAlpha4_Bin2]|nr:MAG: hypothetical protein CFH10_01656 [Alphaproteobacteria bacterium MarineAlpha4_Bin2]
MTKARRVHLITGGYPAGSDAGHDMNYARLRLLGLLKERDGLEVTVAMDFQDIERWLPESDLLVTYVAGPFPVGKENDALAVWLEEGGRWLALHGTSGGKAARTKRDGRNARQMVKGDHHQTLGCFFLNHPPIAEFDVFVADEHPVTKDLPARFTVRDELYMIELQSPETVRILLTTELASDPSPPGFGFVYDNDTSLQPDGKTRVLGYARHLGKGEVVYLGLGHCHSGRENSLSPVDTSIDPTGKMPAEFHDVWETDAFQSLLSNAVEWGLG